MKPGLKDYNLTKQVFQMVSPHDEEGTRRSVKSNTYDVDKRGMCFSFHSYLFINLRGGKNRTDIQEASRLHRRRIANATQFCINASKYPWRWEKYYLTGHQRCEGVAREKKKMYRHRKSIQEEEEENQKPNPMYQHTEAPLLWAEHEVWTRRSVKRADVTQIRLFRLSHTLLVTHN